MTRSNNTHNTFSAQQGSSGKASKNIKSKHKILTVKITKIALVFFLIKDKWYLTYFNLSTLLN